MSVFEYPKSRHNRLFNPRKFKNYRTYKPYLRIEFKRACVYCQQPDSSAPNLNFGVDHYRPKGLPRFASLLCAYANLFYCCSECNSRKNNDWPLDEVAGPRFVNPCDDVMFAHLRFEASTGRMEPKSIHGRHMEEVLQLNEPQSVEYRKITLHLIRRCDKAIAENTADLNELRKRLADGKVSPEDFTVEAAEIAGEIALERAARDRLSGEAVLPAMTQNMKRMLAKQPPSP